MLLLPLQNCLDVSKLETNQNAITSVSIFARLNDPSVVAMHRILACLVLSSYCVEMLEKLEVLVVLESVLYVECERQMIKHSFSPPQIVLGHCLKKCLLVPYQKIIAEMIVYMQSLCLSQ